MWHCDCSLRAFISVFVVFDVLFLYLEDPVLYYHYLIGEAEPVALLFCGLYTVCHGLFALPLGDIGRPCSVNAVPP